MKRNSIPSYFKYSILLVLMGIQFQAIGQESLSSSVLDSLKINSFQILKTKCNSCHTRRNPSKVFTLENMEEHAPKIFKQVFIKKRMPKGNKNNLSQLEYALLKEWLYSTHTF